MTKITTQFTTDLLKGSLGELRSRRAKLTKFILEAGELDVAIREMERCLGRLGLDGEAPARPLAAVPAQRPEGPARPARGSSLPIQPGSNHDRALKVLREHPRGLNTTVIGQQAGISTGSSSVVLAQLVERGMAVKVGRGFWRAAEHSDAA